MKEQFIELETEWMNAWKNKDEKAARKILSDDFTLTSSLSTGALINKEEWINKAMNHFICVDFRIDKLEARVYDNTAILNISFHQNAVANGKDWSGDFLLTDIWVHKTDGWKVVARHASWLRTE